MNKNWQEKHKPTFLSNILPKNEDQHLLVFCEIWTSKITSNGSWLRATITIKENEGVFIQQRSQTVGLSNRQWKHISTSSFLNTIASGNHPIPLAIDVREPPVETRLSLVVPLHQPLVEMYGFHWRLLNRPTLYYHWCAITDTVYKK
jgi:hypothetical protein